MKTAVFLLLSCCVLQCAHGSDLEPSQVKKRLSTLENRIPLPYHPSLLNDIKSYSSKQLPANFSTFEDILSEGIERHGLPPEIIYLPVALTNMKMDYHHDNRAGIWALPGLVALRYGLTVDETHDERFSIGASTEAALHYLEDLYDLYGDWWQCILAYANSPASISNARQRHPKSPIGVWDYYDNDWLPDVRIIGDFISSYYVYSSDDKSVAHSTERYVACDFDQPISVQALSKTIGLPEKKIKSLNPLFLTDPFIPFSGHTLRLPENVVPAFESGKASIYAETAKLKQRQEEKARLDAEEKSKAKEKAKTKEQECITYTVKSGDTLGKIAQRYHVKISDLKKWNKLKGDLIRENQKLKIYP